MDRSLKLTWLLGLVSVLMWGCPEDNEIETPPGTGDGGMTVDGQVDSEPPCNDGDTRNCLVDGARACIGEQTCSGGIWGACAAFEEVCDGADNDCDGVIDNGFAGLREACTAGEGACQTKGRVVCTVDGTGTECDAMPGDGGDEICDGADNDCDGVTDEDVTAGQACGTGEPGACAEGTTVCTGGAVICEPNAEPGDETCNGADDDCDGRTDEGEQGGALAEPCYEGPE
ncbi:MAG: hypothetical protein KC620_26550, partial [Myxococcales bacterium]|nr:hypothetical protein [Myxococcales bacterium]